jgi:hypothetical protein
MMRCVHVFVFCLHQILNFEIRSTELLKINNLKDRHHMNCAQSPQIFIN